MKKYQNKFNELIFLLKNKKLYQTMKFFIKILGIRFLIYKFLYFVLSFFFQINHILLNLYYLMYKNKILY